MARSTIGTFLMYKPSGEQSYTKLVDIKDYPEMKGSPNALDTTTLSDPERTSTPGVKGDNSAKDFTCNYDETKYDAIEALEGTEQDLSIWLGGTESGGVITPTGDDGKFSFKGFVSVRLSSGGVDAVTEMIVSVLPSSAIVKS